MKNVTKDSMAKSRLSDTLKPCQNFDNARYGACRNGE